MEDKGRGGEKMNWTQQGRRKERIEDTGGGETMNWRQQGRRKEKEN